MSDGWRVSASVPVEDGISWKVRNQSCQPFAPSALIYLTQLAEDGSIRIMADLLYREAGQLIAPEADFWLKIVNPELWDSLKAFDANLERARAFWRVHPYLLEHAVVGITKIVNTTYELTGKPFLRSPEQDQALADDIMARLKAQFEKRFAETGSKYIAAGYDFERALNRFQAFIESDPHFEREVFGTFLSQIVATWTAFETLAGDLWRAILVCDPEAVANPDAHSFQSLDISEGLYVFETQKGWLDMHRLRSHLVNANRPYVELPFQEALAGWLAPSVADKLRAFGKSNGQEIALLNLYSERE